MENELKKTNIILERIEVAKLKKDNVKIAIYKKLQKLLYKELKIYLKVHPVLAKLLK